MYAASGKAKSGRRPLSTNIRGAASYHAVASVNVYVWAFKLGLSLTSLVSEK